MPTIDTDEKIIEKFLAGDDPAFEVLVKKYLKPVYNFLCRLSGDREVADDLTQITFVKAWENIKKYNTDKKFKTWLFTIAKNTAYDYFKKKKTIPFSAFSDEEGRNKLEEINDDEILSDEILDRADLARELEKKLEEIPAHYQIILTMRYKDDFSLLEIAEILGEPYNTIKSRHNRALTALKNVLIK